MGGDFAPQEIVKGGVRAAAAFGPGLDVVLVGDEAAVRAELAKHEPVPGNIEIVHASEVVGMDESPATAIRRKKDSSIGRAVDMVKTGAADAVVSAGNTGAVVVAATLKLRTLAGVERPAIATVMPTPGRPFVLIDAGANVDCSPDLLLQFGVMGAVYSREILGESNPVVGLLSIGGESSKGSETTKEAFRLLSESHLNFRGNVEGHDLYRGQTDVIVCDGFVGNVVLKTSESAARAVGDWLKMEFARNPVRMLGALLLRGALRAIKKRTDPETYGGALLTGVNGVCIITHGSSTAPAIYHAVRVARDSLRHQINNLIERGIAETGRDK
jgi:glycerol-3-phosphate acyltransferase PlsX